MVVRKILNLVVLKERVVSSVAGTLSLLSARSGTRLDKTSPSTGGFTAPACRRYNSFVAEAVEVCKS